MQTHGGAGSAHYQLALVKTGGFGMKYIDPVEVSPMNYRTLFEDARVRVLEMRLHPGEKDQTHSHPSETVYFLKGGKLRIEEDGQLVEVELPDGAVLRHDAWTHRVENCGTSEVCAIIAESKAELADEAKKALADRFHMDVFQRGDLDVADEILTGDFVLNGPGYPPEWCRGPAGTKLLARAIITALPDRRITHDETICEGDLVCIRWSMTGTHAGDLLGVPPSERKVKVTGFDLFRMANGRIAELWQNWDQLGLMQQIGAVPGPAAA